MADEREAWENEVLAEVFARAGAIGGGIGGGAGAGAGGLVGGGRGGARGGRWGANRLKNNICELELTLSVGADAALEKVNEVLSQGKPLEAPHAVPGVPTVAALVGSMWQSPAVVTIEIPSSDQNESRLKIRAVAKRSPVMRHTGDKVAERIRQALSSQ